MRSLLSRLRGYPSRSQHLSGLAHRRCRWRCDILVRRAASDAVHLARIPADEKGASAGWVIALRIHHLRQFFPAHLHPTLLNLALLNLAQPIPSHHRSMLLWAHSSLPNLKQSQSHPSVASQTPPGPPSIAVPLWHLLCSPPRISSSSLHSPITSCFGSTN